jgi:metallo-beta-lactamase class B
MRKHLLVAMTSIAMAFALASAAPMNELRAQTKGRASASAIQQHRTAAKTAAGKDHPAIYRTLCVNSVEPEYSAKQDAPRAPGAAAAAPRTVPARSEWYAEPVKVFENLYFVGQSAYSSWAVNTLDGIILIDAIFDYSVEAEVAEGLKKLGLDPARIKYVIISHGHGDHHGGAKFLQEKFGARIVMSATDWDLVEKNTRDPRPKRDMIATDGQQLTLGGTTVTMYLTPGHTPGTISTVFPVRDGGQRHTVVTMGGTGFNFTLTPDKPRVFWYRTYIESVERLRGIAAKAGADVLIANHTALDSSTEKLPALAKRRPGDPHPYVIGTSAVQRYMTVAAECAKANLLTLAP